jgi:two-component system, NtrC family, response regulator
MPCARSNNIPWPGNVRELDNVIKRAVIMCETSRITAAELGLVDDAEGQPLNLKAVRDAAERASVLRALGLSNGNLSRAAELLGVSRPTLYDLVHRFGLKREAVSSREEMQ